MDAEHVFSDVYSYFNFHHTLQWLPVVVDQVAACATSETQALQVIDAEEINHQQYNFGRELVEPGGTQLEGGWL